MPEWFSYTVRLVSTKSDDFHFPRFHFRFTKMRFSRIQQKISKFGFMQLTKTSTVVYKTVSRYLPRKCEVSDKPGFRNDILIFQIRRYSTLIKRWSWKL